VVSRADLPSDDGIILLGRCSDGELRALYANAEIYVAPSDYEGYDIPTVEALLHGCKVICSDIPVHREVVGGFDVGFFEMGSVESLTAALVTARNSAPPTISERARFPSWVEVAARLVGFAENAAA
jgi:glycosyltransferase involved in cell wall biosynthesis